MLHLFTVSLRKPSRWLSCCFLLLTLLLPVFALAQGITVKGQVFGEGNEPLPGVNVLLKGTSNGTSTDVKGQYSIDVPDPNAVLVFSFIGYTPEELPVKGQSTLNVTLMPDIRSLSEVVVVGYGTTKKSDLTGSVATLKGGELNKTPSASVDQLLQGKIPGVQVITSSGQPGAGATIRIRGVSSLNGSNSPLVVVDGFPWGDAGNLKQINPDDIESIEVLKDASSAAIYGSRGANGVIMITTRRAKAGTPRVSFNSLTTLSTLAVKPDVWRDPVEEALYANEAALNGGTAPGELPFIGVTRAGYYAPSVEELRGIHPTKSPWPYNTDWVDLVYRNPISQNYTLGVDGGTENTKYSVSGNYYKEEGLVINNGYDKYTGRLNLEQKISNRLSMGTNLILTYTNSHGRGLGAGRSRIFPVYDSLGNYYKTGPQDWNHPIQQANEVLDKTRTIDVLGTVFASVKVTDWLQFRSQLSTKYGNSVRDVYEPRTATFTGNQDRGFGAIYNGNYSDLLNENYFTINKMFGNAHYLNLVAGNGIQVTTNRFSNLIGREFIADNLQNEALGDAVNRTIQNSLTKSTLESWYGRANYTLNNKYLFTFTGRADGSSKFAENNKWAFFPSGAIAWKVNEEAFMQNFSAVSELKLRASFGLTGNQGLNPYQSLDRFGTGKYWNGTTWETGFGPGIQGQRNQQNIALIEGMENKDLKWETTTSWTYGIDLGFLDQRFTLTADYYVKNTRDLLRERALPPSAGIDKQLINDGEVNNQGVELGLSAQIFRRDNLNWTVGGNITVNRNQVVAMGETNMVVADPNGLVEDVRQNINWYQVGLPVNMFYGYKVDGIIQKGESVTGLTGNEGAPGEFKYVDLNGDGKIDGDDRTIIGNPNPDFIYSFNTQLQFKRFDLSAQLYGVQGNDVFDLRKFTQANKLLRWTEDNPSNEFPRANNARYGYGNAGRASDWFVTDGSFLRIQNVTIGYNAKPNLIRGISSLRVFLSVNNLYTFTKFNPSYDPEVAERGVHFGSYPRPRAFSLGINVGF